MVVSMGLGMVAKTSSPIQLQMPRVNGPVALNQLRQGVPNLTTLLAITVFTPALAGCLLWLSWLRHRRIVALAVWGSGFIVASVAATLIIVARGTISNFWSIIVGNSLLAVAYGILWSGARVFEGKRVSIMAIAGLPLWLVACSIDPIYARPEARAGVMAAIGVCYTLLAVFELWRGRGDGVWRWPIMVLLLCHAATIPIHIPVAGAWKHPDPADVDVLTFMIFEAAFVSICAAYLFGGLVNDRIVASYQRASLTDPLTGVTNRRGFFQVGERLLMRTECAKQPAALIMFDLDHFKTINDKFGHGAGDEVLVAFCRLVTAQLRPNDLFGRIGGEEFASLLPNTTPQDALWLAERVRAAVENASHSVGNSTIRATVSAGVALSNDPATDLPGLLKVADQALYRAKEAGRNCVEISSFAPDHVPLRQPDEQLIHKRTAA
jgi:diguanylate cyclase (GGDEF)-like protein